MRAILIAFLLLAAPVSAQTGPEFPLEFGYLTPSTYPNEPVATGEALIVSLPYTIVCPGTVQPSGFMSETGTIISEFETPPGFTVIGAREYITEMPDCVQERQLHGVMKIELIANETAEGMRTAFSTVTSRLQYTDPGASAMGARYETLEAAISFAHRVQLEGTLHASVVASDAGGWDVHFDWQGNGPALVGFSSSANIATPAELAFDMQNTNATRRLNSDSACSDDEELHYEVRDSTGTALENGTLFLPQAEDGCIFSAPAKQTGGALAGILVFAIVGGWLLLRRKWAAAA